MNSVRECSILGVMPIFGQKSATITLISVMLGISERGFLSYWYSTTWPPLESVHTERTSLSIDSQWRVRLS